jgi:hypothetical protein
MAKRAPAAPRLDAPAPLPPRPARPVGGRPAPGGGHDEGRRNTEVGARYPHVAAARLMAFRPTYEVRRAVREERVTARRYAQTSARIVRMPYALEEYVDAVARREDLSMPSAIRTLLCLGLNLYEAVRRDPGNPSPAVSLDWLPPIAPDEKPRPYPAPPPSRPSGAPQPQ